MDAILQYERKEEDDFYDILGCDELSTTEQINAEYKARVLSCHPDKHPGDPDAAKKFAKLQVAKDTLTDEDKRRNYDTWRRSGICVPYDQWAGLRDSVHTTMHWAAKKKEVMLPGCEASGSCDISGEVSSPEPYISSPTADVKVNQKEVTHIHYGNIFWERDPPSETLRQFRNYEI